VSLAQDRILSLFRETEALLEGHFELTSGLHSPHYFQCAKVLQYPRYAELLCSEIVDHFKDATIDAVVAPALGGIIVGQETGRLLARVRSRSPASKSGRDRIHTMFTERKNNAMQLLRGFGLAEGDRVLVCEDVITTGGSVNEVIDIVRKAKAEVVGVGCVVDRSGEEVRFDVPQQFAVLHMDVVTYPHAGCPLCKQGIPVMKPGSRSSL